MPDKTALFRKIATTGAMLLGVCIPFYACGLSEESEIGVKFGYQNYHNRADNPSSLGMGLFIGVPLTERVSVEGGLLRFGEVEGRNTHNVGAFDVVELSAMYSWDQFGDGAFFGKAGVAPWSGYAKAPSGYQYYDYGVSGLIGVGYRFPILGSVNGRVEYQFIPDMGGDSIGYTDSHFISFGLSLRKPRDNTPAANPITVSPSQHNDQALAAPASEVLPQPQQAQDISTQTKLVVTRELFGSMLFENNTSQLSIPKPFELLTGAQQLLSDSECELQNVSVTGYADNVGRREYNLRLSKARAEKVAEYLVQTTGIKSNNIHVNWFGNKRFGAKADKVSSHYERRVDIKFGFECQSSHSR